MSKELVLLEIVITGTIVSPSDLKVNVKSKIVPEGVLSDQSYSILSRIKKFAYTECELREKSDKNFEN